MTDPQTILNRRRFLQAAGAFVAATAAGTTTATARGPVTLPDGLRRAVGGRAFTPGQAGYSAAAHVYNERFDNVMPLAVARPLDTTDVRSAVRWAVGHGVPLRARSGGHSYAGYSTLSNGLVLDLRNLRGISINRRAGTATIGAGAQLIDVYTALAGQGVTIPAGSCPSVAIGGHAL